MRYEFILTLCWYYGELCRSYVRRASVFIVHYHFYYTLADVPAGADECYNGIGLYITSLNMLHSRLFKETTTAAAREH